MPGYQSTKRFTGLPLVPAATDIAQGAFVKFSSVTGVTSWGVTPVKTFTEEPIGFARASAPKGYGVDIADMPDIKVTTLNGSASISVGAFVGVASASIVTTTGANKIYLPMIAEVSAEHTGTSNSTAKPVWAIGIAAENVAPGTEFAYYFKIKALSGLS